MNSDLDVLIRSAYADPADSTARGALADLIEETYADVALASAVRGPAGVALIRRVIALVEETGLDPTYHLLWAAYHLVPRMNKRPQPAPPPVVVPPTPDDVMPGVPWVPPPALPVERWRWPPRPTGPIWADNTRDAAGSWGHAAVQGWGRDTLPPPASVDDYLRELADRLVREGLPPLATPRTVTREDDD